MMSSTVSLVPVFKLCIHDYKTSLVLICIFLNKRLTVSAVNWIVANNSLIFFSSYLLQETKETLLSSRKLKRVFSINFIPVAIFLDECQHHHKNNSKSTTINFTLILIPSCFSLIAEVDIYKQLFSSILNNWLRKYKLLENFPRFLRLISSGNSREKSG